jgi:hypothetical protein
MKTFEYPKDTLLIVGIDTNAIVLDREEPVIMLLPSRNVDPGLLRAAVFDCISD